MLDSEQLKIVNNRGETYLLHPNYAEFGVLAIDGLSMPDTTVNISESGTTDGGKFNSAHIGVRDIVIHLVMFGWTESERKKLYRMFPAKSAVDLYYRNTQYNVKTTGYVKHIDPVSYYDKTRVRIELTCPDPYLHAVDGITAETAGTTPTVTIKNTADTEIGFTSEITISTEDEPSLNYATTQSETADYLGDHTFCVLPGSYYYDGIDLSTETLNIFVNGEIKTSSDGVTRDLLTDASNHNFLYVQSANGGLANSNVGVEHIVDETQSVTDMRHWLSAQFELLTYQGSGTRVFSGVPSCFDASKNCIIGEYTNGATGRFSVDTEILSQQDDGTYTVKFTYYDNQESGHYGQIRIYGSMSGIDVSTDTIRRDGSTSGWAVGSYTKFILSPTLPMYDPSKDILRVYKGDTLLQSGGYGFQTVTKSDGTTATLFYVTTGTIDRKITFEAISSQDSTDIRGYTQEQIDTAMCLVDGLTITNTVSGEYMAFPNYQFKNGDVLSISTVSGNMYAKVTNAGVDKSLLAEVFNNGSFFKLSPGENTITVTADTNQDYISGTFNAEMLYGGV